MPDSDLTAFLSARLDEDEAAAKAAASVAGPDWHHDNFSEFGSRPTTKIFSAAGSPLVDMLHYDDEEMAPFIVRHDPARVLREVEAGRRILATYAAFQQRAAAQSEAGDMVGLGTWAATRMVHEIIKIRAAVWSGHPDYRQEWAP